MRLLGRIFKRRGARRASQPSKLELLRSAIAGWKDECGYSIVPSMQQQENRTTWHGVDRVAVSDLLLMARTHDTPVLIDFGARTIVTGTNADESAAALPTTVVALDQDRRFSERVLGAGAPGSDACSRFFAAARLCNQKRRLRVSKHGMALELRGCNEWSDAQLRLFAHAVGGHNVVVDIDRGCISYAMEPGAPGGETLAAPS